MSSHLLQNLALRRAIAAALSGGFVWLLLTVSGGWVQVADVTASGSYDVEHGPERATDALTQETPNGSPSWLLPDGQTGAIRFAFGARQRLDEARILNTRNRLYFDRATLKYRLALVDRTGTHVVADGVLPSYPGWTIVPLHGRVAQGAVVYVDSFDGLGGGLAEVAFRGEPARGFSWNLTLALACALLVAVLFPWLSQRLGAPGTRPRLVLAALIAALTAAGLRSLHFFTSVSVFEWLMLFDVHQLVTLADVVRFFAELRAPIPPWLALLEIGTYAGTGDIDFVTRDLYLFSIIAAHAIAVALMYPSIGRMVLAAAVSAVCIAGTGVVHQANPQIYDTVFGFLTVASVGLLVWAARAPAHGRWRAILLGAAGTTLSLWGLTRPFALLLLPLPIAFVLVRFADQRARGWVTFLAPIALLCGVWHAQLFLRHGQIGMSNHTGFNLHRAWPMVQMPTLLPETEAPPYRVNNPDHARNSALLQRAVLQYIATHPSDALRHVLERLAVVLKARTDFPGRHEVTGQVVAPYRFVVRLLMALALFALVVRAVQAVDRVRKRRPVTRAELASLRTSDLALALLGGMMLLVAIGEAGEESRFVISFLPLLVSTLGMADLVPRPLPSEPTDVG